MMCTSYIPSGHVKRALDNDPVGIASCLNIVIFHRSVYGYQRVTVMKKDADHFYSTVCLTIFHRMEVEVYLPIFNYVYLYLANVLLASRETLGRSEAEIYLGKS